MQFSQDVSLKNYSTMRLGGLAKYMAEVNSIEQVKEAVSWAEANKIEKIIMIGQGSNIVWRDEGYDGLVLLNKIKGFELQPNIDQVYLTVGAGEVWDSVVERTTSEGLSGIETLSLIPGLAGATPVQNVGAYGREIKDTLILLQAYDRQARAMVTIPNSECNFGYRTSRFKANDKDRFLITSITLSLSKNHLRPPFYATLANYLAERKITDYSPAVIRQAVIDIRRAKLPDPAKVANCGSFFSNPIIPRYLLEELKDRYPNIRYWDVENDNVKVSAAWLLESLGLKGYHEKNIGMAIWDKQPLVLVNENAKNTVSLIAFRDAIVKSVKEKFGIQLEQEPEII